MRSEFFTPVWPRRFSAWSSELRWSRQISGRRWILGQPLRRTAASERPAWRRQSQLRFTYSSRLAPRCAMNIAICRFSIFRQPAPRLAALNRLSKLWVALVICQIALGAWVIWSNKAADVATAHVALGAIMLCFGVSISAICWRISDTIGALRRSEAQARRPYLYPA